MRKINQPCRLGAIFLALALVLAAGPASAAQIQNFEPDFYASELSGLEIEVSGPLYEITEAEIQHYPSGEGEIVRISSDSVAANLEVSFFDDGDTPEESLDIYLRSIEGASDEMEVIERGVDGDLHYLLAVIEFDGIEIVYYLQVEEDIQGNVDRLQSILTAADMLEIDLADAQSEVTIDGIPFMDNIDAGELADVASGTGSLGESEEATPVVPAETFIFTDSQVEIGIGPDFSFVGPPEQRVDVEVARIQGPNTLSMVAIGQTGSTPDVVLKSFSSGIESNYTETVIVDEEITDDYAWRLLSIPKEVGDATFMLITVDASIIPGYEVMHAHEVPSESVAGSLVLIQEQFSLNGAPMMPEVDPEEIANIAAGVPTGQSTQISETPEATEEPDSGRTGDPREDARLPGSEDEDDGGNTSETGGSIDATVEPVEEPVSQDSDVPGELTDSSWEGAVHGHLIEWEAPVWFVDTEYEDDLVSDDEAQEDTIVLQSESSNGTSWLYISVYGGDQNTPQDYLDHWVSDEYLATFAESGAEAEVVESRTRGGNSAVMIEITDESGSEYLVVRQAISLESGAVLVVTLDTPAADMIEKYDAAQDVTIDDESVLRVFSPSQIQRTIGD